MRRGQKFKRSVEESPYTKAQFARLMKVEPQDIQNWMNRGVPAKQAFKAGRLLGKNPEWLAFDDDDLESHIKADGVARADYATAMFDLLTDDQAALVARLIQEIAAK